MVFFKVRYDFWNNYIWWYRLKLMKIFVCGFFEFGYNYDEKFNEGYWG